MDLPHINAVSVGDRLTILALRCIPAIAHGLRVCWPILWRDRDEALIRFGHPPVIRVFSSVPVTWYSALHGIAFWVASWQRIRALRMRLLPTGVVL